MTAATDIAEILTVGLGGETFALPATIVREILDLGPVTPVPTAPAFVGRLINVRGRVVPLADLRLRFGMPAAEATIDTRVVVLEIEVEGEPTVVAILADKVYEVAHLDAVVTDEVPRVGMRWRPEFVRAIGRRNGEFVMVLDIGKVFASAEQAYVAEA
ncbi:MAG: chemotaxis protein CheW [Actinomycetota bacterium]